MERITPAEFQALQANKKKSKANKYNAKRTGSNASGKEHWRAGELRIMQAKGLIKDLREQVKFILIPIQTDKNGEQIESQVGYIADFVYKDCETGETIVEDTKGFKTQDYLIKRKLMLYIHGIRIKEI